MSSILFLSMAEPCHSRFTELLFNHLARERFLPWIAFSRSLVAGENVPDASLVIARGELERFGVSELPALPQRHLIEEDFRLATRCVAIGEGATDSPLASACPRWEPQVEHWPLNEAGHCCLLEELDELAQRVGMMIWQLASPVPPLCGRA